MLLLLPNFEDAEFSDFEFRQIGLRTLLTDLGTGHAARTDKTPVFRDPYSHMHDEAPVALLRMGHFREEDDAIDWDAVSADLQQSIEYQEKEVVERRLILQADDLLLSLRGQPRVIRISGASLDAMPEALVQRGFRLAPNNNFILIRSHPQLVQVPFLHLLLQVLLEYVLEAWHAVLAERPISSSIGTYLQQKYEERTGSSKSPGYPIGTRELKALVLSIPTDQTAQMKLVEHYRQIRDEELMIKKRMRNFHSRLTYLTNPNIMP